MRTRADAFLLDTCTIAAPTNTGDGTGGFTVSYSNRGTAIPCYLEAIDQIASMDTIEQGERPQTFTEYTLHLASGGTIVTGDRVTLDSNSNVYQVEGVIDPVTRRGYLSAKLTLSEG
jgi:hypothetical protein